MRILVTGASGFIGRHVVNTLSQEYELICLLHNPERAKEMTGVEIIKADLSSPLRFKSLPERVDAILHLAQANVDFPEGAKELFAVNVGATQDLAGYARRAGASHFVFTSTGSVYAPKRGPLTESDPVSPKSYYAETKYGAERLLQWYQDYFGTCILRLFVPYGPGQSGRMIPNIMDSVLHGKPIFLTNDGQPRSNPIYIEDLVRILKLSLTLKDHHVVNVAGPEVVSVKDIALLAGQAIGREPIFELRSVPSAYDLIADVGQMRNIFGDSDFRGMSFGIRQMLEVKKERTYVRH